MTHPSHPSSQTSHPFTRILILRHAETAAPDLFHGAESDIGLSAEGLRQAQQAGETLRHLAPAALYSSTLRRARETARAISTATGLDVQIVPDLHERKMGPLSGVPRLEFWHHYEDARARWMAGDLDATHEGGESYRAMRARLLPAFQTLARAHPGQTIALVAHGVVIRVLLTSLVTGLSPADFSAIPIDYCRIHELQPSDSGWSLSTPHDDSPTTQPW